MTIRAAIYARTSPDCSLTEDDQIDRLKSVAADRGWTIEHIFTDRPTSVKARQDRRVGELALMSAICRRAVDKVLVCSIDRVGRSLIELVGFMETCRAAGVSVYMHEQGLDSSTSNGMSFFEVTALLAQHLRGSRRDRILRGQAAARSLKIRFGRPPIPSAKVEKAKRELAAGKGVRQVARLSGISPASVSRLKAAHA